MEYSSHPAVLGEHFLLGPPGHIEVHRVKVHPEDVTRIGLTEPVRALVRERVLPKSIVHRDAIHGTSRQNVLHPRLTAHLPGGRLVS